MANEVNIKFRVRGVIDQADTSNTTNSLVTMTRGADTAYEFSADYYKTFDAVSPKTVTLAPTVDTNNYTKLTTDSISRGDVVIFKNVSDSLDEDLKMFAGSAFFTIPFAEISPGESIFIVSDGSHIYGQGQGIDTCTIHVIHFETTPGSAPSTPATALALNGEPLTLSGEYITYT